MGLRQPSPRAARATSQKLAAKQFGPPEPPPTCQHCGSDETHTAGSATRTYRICRSCGMAGHA